MKDTAEGKAAERKCDREERMCGGRSREMMQAERTFL